MLGSRRDRDGCAAVWTRDGAGSGCVEEWGREGTGRREKYVRGLNGGRRGLYLRWTSKF